MSVIPCFASAFRFAIFVSNVHDEKLQGEVRSPAARSKSVFSRNIATKRSNVFPLTLLVGLNVFAVARAAATSAALVEVYCVCAFATLIEASTTAVKECQRMLQITICTNQANEGAKGKKKGKKRIKEERMSFT